MSDAATKLSLHSKFLDLSQSTSEEDTPGTFTDVGLTNGDLAFGQVMPVVLLAAPLLIILE
jgi:hypothetical protein